MLTSPPVQFSLREINFGDCLLKTNGAYHIAEALEENHLELKILDLSFNEIGPDGGIVLAKALLNKPNLTRVNLDGNHVSRNHLTCFFFLNVELISLFIWGAGNPTNLFSSALRVVNVLRKPCNVVLIQML